MLNERYQKLFQQIKITFEDLNLLDLAFVHKSYLNEHRDYKIAHNERLEFLGDAVLELVTTEFLYKKYPNQEEGVLTSYRSALVKGNHLAKIAKDLDLGLYLYLSRGEERSGGRSKNYILANTLEALIGAIYLDQGYITTHQFINQNILNHLEHILSEGAHIDAKSHLQEISQKLLNLTPNYRLVSETGPDHNKVFLMAVYFGDEKVSDGTGSSKQKAESDAAQNAINIKEWQNIKLSID